MKSADYYLQKKNYITALPLYLWGGDLDKVVELGEDEAWMEQCRCAYNYIDIAHAYILQGKMDKAREYYDITLNKILSWREIDEIVAENIEISGRLNDGFSAKAKVLWKEVRNAR